jgi:hypothetical protein
LMPFFVWRKVVLKGSFIVWFLTPSMWHPSHAPTPLNHIGSGNLLHIYFFLFFQKVRYFGVVGGLPRRWV